MKEQVVVDMAKAHSTEPGNILLSYLANRNIAVLPKSVTPARIAKNLELIDLSKQEIDQLSAFARETGTLKKFCQPPWGVDLKVGLVVHIFGGRL